jgi:broad specificity phosphatase PhoE
MSTTFLVVRHGQTDWNKDYPFRGRADLALNAVGEHQAELIAQRLAADYQPGAIYSSPLRRSIQTAEAIANRVGLQPEVEDGLVDLDFGEFSGLTRAEAETKFPEVYRRWLNAPHITRFPRSGTG